MTVFPPDPSNPNSIWCGVIAETLVRCGVRHAVLSPGSRSTPLTLAFVRHPGLECTPVLDERSAAFFALGIAKRTGSPAVLVCTSGTAAANYLPALIEAHESGVPLLVLTADRPPELRACGSGQTIDQQKLFGAHVLQFHEMAVPEASLALLTYARQLIARSIQACVEEPRGPVHLNCPFRDPLHPEPHGDHRVVAEAVSAEEFYAHLLPADPVGGRFTGPLPILAGRRGVIVAGPSPEGVPPSAHAAQVSALSRALGWPVLADTLSQLRQFPSDCPSLVTHYDTVLRSPELASRLRPECALLIGALPTSKVLRAWLGSAPEPELYQVHGYADGRDPLHGRTRVVASHLGDLLARLGACHPGEAEASYVQAWLQASARARSHIEGILGPSRELTEPRLTWLLASLLPRDSALFVANSMPVRDLEYLWGATARGVRVFFNRGANGIDGTLSTAVGVAHRGSSTNVLIGDLSFLHDSNALLLARRFRGSLTVILVDNNGGGIFGHLPVARFEPPFEEFFATPQFVDFKALAATHGLAYCRVETGEEFAEQFRLPPQEGVRLIHVCTDRRADAALRKSLFAAAALAAESATGT